MSAGTESPGGAVATPGAVDVIGICVLAFITIGSYELSRSGVESLFLEVHGSHALPWAWAAVAAVTLGAVAIYYRLATRMRLLSLLVWLAAVSAVTFAVLAGLRAAAVPGSVFALYVWKDVHVVILLEILWTFANLVFSLRTARWVYGIFCVSGSLGGLTGGLLAGVVAMRWGTGTVIWMPVAGLGLLAACAAAFGGRMTTGLGIDPRPRGAESVTPGRPLSQSPYIAWMVLLVGVVQVVITLVDYEYNAALEVAFPDTDSRTQVIGLVYGAINVAAVALQLLSGPVLWLVGVPAVLLTIPSVLGSALVGYAAVRRFGVMAATKVASKALDYSLFRAAKEILYIPLGREDKTRGKALVDMFVYRFAKGGASVLLGLLVVAGLASTVVWWALGLVVLWIAVTVQITRRYRRLVPRSDELGRRARGA